MYSLYQLEIFKKVADEGSFNKAALELYITPSAVTRHINNLETELGVSLFERTFRGIYLTSAGAALYNRANHLLQFANETQHAVKEAAEENKNIIRIGVSVMTPYEPIKEWLMKVSRKHPEFKFEAVLFDNVPSSDNGYMFPTLGNKIDFIVDSFDNSSLAYGGTQGYELYKVGIYAVMSTNHRLAGRESIDISDLRGEILVHRNGTMKYIDDFCNHLVNEGIEVTHKIIDSYSIDIYNECAATSEIVLGVGPFKGVHPFLERVPINYSKQRSFGLIYASEPAANVYKLIDVLNEMKGKL